MQVLTNDASWPSSHICILLLFMASYGRRSCNCKEFGVGSVMAAHAAKWKNPSTGTVRMFHSAGWGGWAFEVDAFNPNGPPPPPPTPPPPPPPPGWGPLIHCTVRVFRQKFTLEDAIGSHACSLEANMRVTNGIPLGSSLLLPVHTVICVQTLKAHRACHTTIQSSRFKKGMVLRVSCYFVFEDPIGIHDVV
jgi:hypothetical protein